MHPSLPDQPQGALAGRILGLASGRIVFDGPPSALDDAALEAIYGPAGPPREVA